MVNLENIKLVVFTFNSNMEGKNIDEIDLSFDKYILMILRNGIKLKNIQ